MPETPTLVSVVGARPQFVKLAPIVRAFERRGACAHRIVHTGQHYDEKMSASFFDQLEIPKPDIDLGVGSASHAVQTAEMLTKLEEYFASSRPDAVLTYGDTNSTLAATLAATKIHIPTVHIEAGLRSFNREMPEELNRLVADHCSDRLYAPTPQAMANLDSESLRNRAVLTGDVMLDAIQHNIGLANRKSSAIEDYELGDGEYGLVTVHRPVNTTGDALNTLMEALEDVAANYFKLIFPVHPRTRSMLDEMSYKAGPNLRIIDPVSYLDVIALIRSATVVITDSGGMQKEAAFLRTPCLTMRDETEWVETVNIGVNTLVGYGGPNLMEAVVDLKSSEQIFDEDVERTLAEHYGNGEAARTIVDDCLGWVSELH